MDKPVFPLSAVLAAVLLSGGSAAAADAVPQAAGPAASSASGTIDRLLGEVARFRAYPHFDRAYRLMSQGRDRDALPEIEAGLKHEPANTAARLAWVDALTRLGRREQALRQASLALAHDPQHPGALRRRAVLLDVLGRKDEALADARALLAQPSASAEDRSVATSLLAQVKPPAATGPTAATPSRLVLEAPAWTEWARSAEALEAQGRWREAVADYQKAIRLTADNDTRLNLWDAQARIARRQNDTVLLHRSLAQIAALAPRNTAVLRELVTLAQRTGNRADAQRWMQRLAAVSKSATDHESLAHLHYAAGNASFAAEGYRRALAQARELQLRHRLSMSLGHALTALEDHAAAAQAFQSAAALSPTPQALQAASQALHRSGDRDGAIDVLQTLVQRYPGPANRLRLAALLGEDEQGAAAIAQARAALAAAQDNPTRLQAQRRLALLHAQQGDMAASRGALADVVRLAPGDHRARLALAQACAELGDSAGAATHFETSAKLRPSVPAYRGLVAARARLGDVAGGIAAYRGLLAQPDLEPSSAASANAGLADLLMTHGDPAQAERAYRAAVDGGLDQPAVRLGLGYALANQQRPNEALVQFKLAYQAEPRSSVALQLARTHMALQEAEPALRYAEAALADTSELAPEQHKQLLSEMATLHAGLGQTRQAAAMRERAFALWPEPGTALALAQAQLADQQPQAAQRTLAAWPAKDWPAALASEHLDLGSQIKARDKNLAEARAMLSQAHATAPSAERQYRLALLDIELGQTQAALVSLDSLMRSQPKAAYREGAALALYNGGQFGPAAALYGRALKDEPQRVDLRRAQAYSLMRDGQNDAAAAAFRQAIDAARAGAARAGAGKATGKGASLGARRDTLLALAEASAPDAAPTQPDTNDVWLAAAAADTDAQARELDIWRMRQEVRKLNKNFDFSVYQSYRDNDTSAAPQSGAGAGGGGGALPSQGGVEAAWRPPVIGLRDDRTLHVFGRMTWSNRPGSLSIDHDTVQGSVGVRYKPFRTQQFYAGAERLLKSGSATRNDWLLRASYGWTDGLDIADPRATQWNYSSFYADIGRFTDQRVSAAYVEARQGRTWKVADNLLLSPHVVLNARHQRPDPDRSSYSEAGIGVSLRGFFNETEYEAPRGSAELLLQYKHGLKRVGNGWAVTAILAF